jgi:hypothetical protein
MKAVHPAFEFMMERTDVPSGADVPVPFMVGPCMSLSLARVLAAGCLARLDPAQTSVSVWDPSVGEGFAGHLLTEALLSSGVQVQFRGQDIARDAVAASRVRFDGIPDAQFAVGDTLSRDEFGDFFADLVIVDAPWGMDWATSAPAVESRRQAGEFRFGLPQRNDSTWLFISLALEKLRRPEDGGGRVVALVNPGALSHGGINAEVRRRVLDAGLLESVVRLPEGLAPNTSLPLYLLTFSNRAGEAGRGKAMIADLQTQFTTVQRRRKMMDSAIRELESGLRTGRPGPRNRTVTLRTFIRREAQVSRRARQGQKLDWRITTFRDTAIDTQFLDARYGPDAGVSIVGAASEAYDLDPGRALRDDAGQLLKSLAGNDRPALRLSGLIEASPRTSERGATDDAEGDALFVPTTRFGRACSGAPDPASSGRVLAVEVDRSRIDPQFLAAWLNSEQGATSRLRAIDASSSGSYLKALRSEPKALMRWADELIVPVPPMTVQERLATADARLASFQDELDSQREGIWSTPDEAEAAVGKFAKVFDDSIAGWLAELPFPVASALWTAETARTPGDKLEAYFHAWEALVAFHATALLSACRSDPGSSVEVESSIRKTLDEHGIGINRASFGTWNVIIEQTSKALRRALNGDDSDEIARVRSAFSDLGAPTIARLLATEATSKFKVVGDKRNRWRGHSGHVADERREEQIEELIADLRDLRRIVGDAWSQLPLVRAGSSKRGRTGYSQIVEVAMGTGTPFRTEEIHVADAMHDGELYLVRDGSRSPLRLVSFVQLRGAPSDAHYTSYFYNRTEGSSVRMVSYQYGPESEAVDDAARLREDFGALMPE